jgi:hypothetical protein
MTVPVPMPSSFAVLRMPAPVFNRTRIRATTASLTGRRPRRFPWFRARARPGFTRSTIMARPHRTHFLLDGSPNKKPWMGTLSGIGHPPLSPAFPSRQPDRPRFRGRGPPSLLRATERWIVPSNSGVPFLEGTGTVFTRNSGRPLLSLLHPGIDVVAPDLRAFLQIR